MIRKKNSGFTIVINGYCERLRFIFKSQGSARCEVSSPFTTHSQCPLVRWHLQCSRQDGSRAGQHQSKLLGLLSANPFQCGSTVCEPHASSTSGQQIWSIHVVRTCGQDNGRIGPWLTDSVCDRLGLVREPLFLWLCLWAALPAVYPGVYVWGCISPLSLCTNACSRGTRCQATWLPA